MSQELDSLYRQVRTCQSCALSKTRTNAVPGEGPEQPRIMFIGEAPGYHEDQQGRPFVGQAGKFLDELLSSIGLKRPDVYIGNIIKCRPPNNRDPLPNEVAACAPYLETQLGILRPEVIVTLGRHSLARYMPGETISKVHGRPREVNGILVFPMYHPAAALHQPAYRKVIIDDMSKLPGILAARKKREEDSRQEAREQQPVQQLELF